MLPYWPQLSLFAGAVLLVALYGLTVSGHFPAEFRGARLQGIAGAVVLWSSMAAAGVAAALAMLQAWQILPWYAAVIGAGAALLFAPLLLRPLPDSFVNGRLALVAFSAGATVLAAVPWMAL